MNTVKLLTLGLVVGMLLTGCATVESRIQDNMSAFLMYSPEEQAMIREGRIGLGFTPEMVRIALGRPRRIYTRQSDAGIANVWAYVREISDGRFHHPYFVGRHSGHDRFFLGYDSFYWRERTREIDVLRVEFRNGKVIGIERLDE
jgi:hypothetical protein